MSLWRRLDEKYNTHESPNILLATEPTDALWELAIVTTPNHLGLGVCVERQFGESFWPDWISFCVHLGPWSIGLRREWNYPDDVR